MHTTRQNMSPSLCLIQLRLRGATQNDARPSVRRQSGGGGVMPLGGMPTGRSRRERAGAGAMFVPVGMNRGKGTASRSPRGGRQAWDA